MRRPRRQGAGAAGATRRAGAAGRAEANSWRRRSATGGNAGSLAGLRFAIKGSHPGLIAFLCEKADLEILGMKRIRLGRVTLADLPVGQWRYLAGWEKF